MNDKLPKYAVWVAIILLLLWGFYRSGSIERVTETETIGGEDLSLTIPAIPRTETEIRWIEKQSAANDISITSDCCTAPREYTAPVRNYRPPDYDLEAKPIGDIIVDYVTPKPRYIFELAGISARGGTGWNAYVTLENGKRVHKLRLTAFTGWSSLTGKTKIFWVATPTKPGTITDIYTGKKKQGEVKDPAYMSGGTINVQKAVNDGWYTHGIAGGFGV